LENSKEKRFSVVMGRKRKEGKLKVISFRIEPELYLQLKRMKKYSLLIRNAVKKAIENYE
jgi:hypothetical protein